MLVGFGAKRSFLFLQGLSTPFWSELATEIENRGHIAHRILFSGGDRAFWSRPGAVSYRGSFADWRKFLGGFLHESGVSDIVLFGDCRPYHRVAMELARSRGISVHVFEEGYFRPHWITLEREGTNAYSSLPRNPEAILEEAARLGSYEEAPKQVSGGFGKRVFWEVVNQTATMLLAPLYPKYRRHRSHHPVVEMCGWLKRLFRSPLERQYMVRLSGFLRETDKPYYLLPLQLETDYQIRRHSKFGSMAKFMEEVMESFARSAPAEAMLLIKIHPLDNGLANFRKQAKRIAGRLGISDRILVMEGGHLPTLLSKCGGVVIVNSTTGLSAIHRELPVKVLGNAIFDIPGLTYQGTLDSFWTEATTPDMELFTAFRRVVLAQAQVNGSFFTTEGRALAVQDALARMQVTPAPSTVLSPATSEKTKIAAAKPAVLVNQ